MREILFRGKRVDNGEWVYGYYVLDPENRHRIYWKPFESASSNTYHFVDPETVGQFTGLTDKNGIKIFEGDILRVEGVSDVIVFFDNSMASFRLKLQNGAKYQDGTPVRYGFEETEPSEIDIIGNIHDNQELIIK